MKKYNKIVCFLQYLNSIQKLDIMDKNQGTGTIKRKPKNYGK